METEEKKETKDLIKKDKPKKTTKKDIIFIILTLLLCYLSMDLLNGTYLDFSALINFSLPLPDRFTIFMFIFQSQFINLKFVFNIIIIISLYLFLYGITNRTKLSCIIIYVFTMIFGTLNYIVTNLRGVSISISDIFSVKTALSVSDGLKVYFIYFFPYLLED